MIRLPVGPGLRARRAGWTAILGLVFCGAATHSAEPPSGSRPAREPVTALTFSPDGRSLLSGGYARITVRAETGVPPRLLKVAPQQVRDLAFHPSGKWLAAAGGTPGAEGGVEVLEWPGGGSIRKLRDHQDIVHAAAFDPSGELLATAGADRRVRLYDFDPAGKGAPVVTPLPALEGHSGPVLALAFSPDGKLLLTAGVDRSLRVWEPRAGKLVRVFTNHLDTVHALAFAPAAAPGGPPAYCASASEDRTVRIWQPEIGRMVRILRGFEGPVLALTFSRDREQLFCADTTGTVRVFDAGSDQVLRTWSAHPGWIYRLVLSLDGKRLASGDWSGSVRVWNPVSGEGVRW